MAIQGERACSGSCGAILRKLPISKIATAAILLLIAGSIVIFFIGIFNFGYAFGPALIGIGIVLFVLVLLSSGIFWACARKKQGGDPLPPPNRNQTIENFDGNAISVINQHFDMYEIGLDPPPDYWAHLPPDQFSGSPKDFQHGRHQHQASAAPSGETPAVSSPPYEGPPPSYWEALRADH